ncbi:TolC family protein [Acidithiobacillus thiooxidans]|uniref:TolC family protein n=1 Tax=Acidithiobacillus thiooxidans TaxID=930 RepID=UPI001593C0D9|nr:TolC family protein [Acidithiobacillus thiooxidans]
MAGTLDHDPQVQLYRQQLEVASQSQPLALAKLLPQISVHASAQWDNHRIQKPYDKYDPNSVLFSRGRHNIIQRWSAQISQTLFNWSALQNYRASGDQVAAAAAQYQESVQKLERSAIVAYGNWLLAYANLQNLKASEKGVARQAYAAEARYRSGTTGILGADEAKVALARIRAQLAQALAKWHGAGAVLEQFTGKNRPRRPLSCLKLSICRFTWKNSGKLWR